MWGALSVVGVVVWILTWQNNLRTLVSTYFVEPSNMRDAFLESIGRDLVDLGWQLTDGSDGALYSRGAPKP